MPPGGSRSRHARTYHLIRGPGGDRGLTNTEKFIAELIKAFAIKPSELTRDNFLKPSR